MDHGDLQRLGSPEPALATIPGIALGTYKTGQPYRQTSAPIRVPCPHRTVPLVARHQLVYDRYRRVIFEVTETWLSPEHSEPTLGFVNGEQGVSRKPPGLILPGLLVLG